MDVSCMTHGASSWLAVTKGLFSEIKSTPVTLSFVPKCAAPFAFGLHAEAAWTTVSGAGGFLSCGP